MKTEFRDLNRGAPHIFFGKLKRFVKANIQRKKKRKLQAEIFRRRVERLSELIG